MSSVGLVRRRVRTLYFGCHQIFFATNIYSWGLCVLQYDSVIEAIVFKLSSTIRCPLVSYVKIQNRYFDSVRIKAIRKYLIHAADELNIWRSLSSLWHFGDHARLLVVGAEVTGTIVKIDKNSAQDSTKTPIHCVAPFVHQSQVDLRHVHALVAFDSAHVDFTSADHAQNLSNKPSERRIGIYIYGRLSRDVIVQSIQRGSLSVADTIRCLIAVGTNSKIHQKTYVRY